MDRLLFLSFKYFIQEILKFISFYHMKCSAHLTRIEYNDIFKMFSFPSILNEILGKMHLSLMKLFSPYCYCREELSSFSYFTPQISDDIQIKRAHVGINNVFSSIEKQNEILQFYLKQSIQTNHLREFYV